MIPPDSPKDGLIYKSKWHFINSLWGIFLSARKHIYHLLGKPPWGSELRSGYSSNIKAKGIRRLCKIPSSSNGSSVKSPFSTTKQFSPTGQVFPATGTLVFSQGLHILILQLSRNLYSSADRKTLVFGFSGPYSFREDTYFKSHFQEPLTSALHGSSP